MRRLYYAGGQVLVSDQICKATLRYSRALAITNTSDVVSIPTISEDLKQGYAHLLIGPSSQLFSTPADDLGVELDDLEVVKDMEKKTRELQPARPVWSEDMPEIHGGEVYDFLE